MQTLEDLVGRSFNQLPQGQEEASKYFRKLDELHQVILSSPPNLHLMVREPFTVQAVQEMKKLVQLLLGSAVQCEERDVFIGRIQSLDISVQAALACAIREVSQEPESVLGLQWREMDPASMQQLLWDLGVRVQKLVSERDAGLEQLWELQQKEGPPLVAQLESNQSHLGVQLAERQAQVRRLQGELEMKMEELLDQQEESRNLEKGLRKLQQENRTLAGEARQARLYQDELDALREKALRAERLHRFDSQEERDFSKALLEAKATMEEELDAAYARGQCLSRAEKENLNLQNHLNQIQEEREQLSYRLEELLRENLVLKKQLQETLKNSRTESCSKDSHWDANERRPSQAEEENLTDAQERNPGILTHRKSQTAEGRAPPPESETSLAETKAALSRAQTQLREAEQKREAESGQAASLQEKLRRVQEAYAEAQEECDRWHSETERLVEEIQALEREKETLKAGSQVLQDAATRAEVHLSQAQQTLRKEHLRSTQLAQKLQQREEELGEAQQELQNLQRSLEHHRVSLAQLGAEKGALEEALGQAESCRRQGDKESWRLKAKSQAQEDALAEQGRQLALLEAQTCQQAAELNSLQEVLQRAGERKGWALQRESGRAPGPALEEAAKSSAGDQHQDTVLQGEDSALTGRLTQLESLASSLETVLLGLARQRAEGREGDRHPQPGNSTSQHSLLARQLSEVRQRSGRHEAEVQTVRLEAEAWRRRYEHLRLDHDRLALLHRQQGEELERTLSEQAGLKAALRGLEKEQRELESRCNQLLGQKNSLELQEVALQAQKERLEVAKRQHRDLAEQHANLKEEHERRQGGEDAFRNKTALPKSCRVKQALVQAERAQDDLQGELQGTQNRLTGLQLEQAKLEAENAALKEQNQQLDTALGRLSTQCELLVQLKGKQEEENRHLLQEIQLLSRENRQLLERSMENREQFQEEQRQYHDKLGELRREKQKLVEKIMDQYRVLEPAIPRGNAPSSPFLLRKASSNLSIPEGQPVPFRHCRLSSRMPAAEPSGFGEEDGQDDTPRRRFRQRRLGVLWGAAEDPAAPAGESEPPSQLSTTSEEKRGEA
ncbi:hypothetical protein Chor_005190 [Crotalus horridus]